MYTTFTATEVIWILAPVPDPIAEAAAESAESIGQIWDQIDETAAALVKRVPEFRDAILALFLDLRERIYGQPKS